jgi:uncharacterized membrane protein
LHDPLHLPATPHRVRRAAPAAGLSPRALDRALEIATRTPLRAEWHRFLSRTLTLFGAALVLAGIVCFFAYNWNRIGRFGKLGLIEAGIIAATVVGWWRLPRPSGQIALTAAAVLVGPLLGVIGQTYQTGADPYNLFLTWALVIIPWVIAARFTTLWVVEVVVLDVALALWWSQALSPSTDDRWVGQLMIVALVHAIAIVAWEWQYRRPTPWLTQRWAPHGLALVGFIALVLGGSWFVLEPEYYGGRLNAGGAIALAALIGAIATAFWYYQQVRVDRFMVTVAGAAGLALAAVVVGRVAISDLRLEAFGWLVLAMFVVAEITFGLRWLRETQRPGTGPTA